MTCHDVEYSSTRRAPVTSWRLVIRANTRERRTYEDNGELNDDVTLRPRRGPCRHARSIRQVTCVRCLSVDRGRSWWCAKKEANFRSVGWFSMRNFRLRFADVVQTVGSWRVGVGSREGRSRATDDRRETDGESQTWRAGSLPPVVISGLDVARPRDETNGPAASSVSAVSTRRKLKSIRDDLMRLKTRHSCKY